MGTGMQVAQLLAKALGLDKRTERQLIVFFAGLDKVRAMIRDVSGHTPHIKDFYAESASLGLVEAEEFRSGNANQPGNGFTGGRFGMGPSNTGFAYNGVNFFLVGVANDVAQAGISLNDGKIYAGAGTVVLDNTGIFIKNNQSGKFSFGDATNTPGLIRMHSGLGNDLNITNAVPGGMNGGIRLFVLTTAGELPGFYIKEDPAQANRFQVDLGLASQGSKFTMGGQVEIHGKGSSGGTTYMSLNGNIIVNESGLDQDSRFEGDTDQNLLFLDASTDRAGVGTSLPAEKLDVAGNIKSSGTIEAAGGLVGPGWTSDARTWTRTGNHTFTIASDVTAIYAKGTKVRYKDGGAYEYGVVFSASYSSPNTTITLITNTDYAMAAATITDTYYSYSSPPDFPAYFAFTPVWTASPTPPAIGKGTIAGRFSVTGKLLKASIEIVTGSTTTYGSGPWVFGLAGGHAMSQWLRDAAAGLDAGTAWYVGATTLYSAATVTIVSGSGSWESTFPHTWAYPDQLGITLTGWL